MKELPRKTVVNVIYQLIDAGVLERSAGERPVLGLNDASWEVLRGQRPVPLFRPKKAKSGRTRLEEASWQGVDAELFESLRRLPREVAAERGVPAYVIFHDSTLRELARLRPASLERLRAVRGLGERRLLELGSRLLETIAEHERKRERTEPYKPGSM